MNLEDLTRGTKKIIANPWKAFFYMGERGMLSFLDDEAYIRLMYRASFNGQRLDLDNPQTYNEKLQWLKLHNRKPEYSIMVDKYEVKKYVADKIGEKYIIPTLGLWDKFEDINFDELPSQFVLKCTHDSGGLVICTDRDRFDLIKARKKIERSLRTNYYKHGREWAYKNVKPRIIAEQYMEDSETRDLRDYKFFAFDGVPRVMFIATERNNTTTDTRFDFFDMDFQHLDIRNGHPNADIVPSKPATFEKMKELTSVLSKGIPHVRVDFYEVDGEVYFGELTFNHWGGFKPFDPPKWDKIFGDWIVLPEVQ